MTYEIQIGDRPRSLEIRALNGGWAIQLDGQPLEADVCLIPPRAVSLLIEGRSFTFHWERLEGAPGAARLWLAADGCQCEAEIRDPRRMVAQRRVEQAGRVRLCAPMSGKVVRLLAAVGDTVAAGQGLVVLEAMKMQNEVRSPKSGTLLALPVPEGATVATGQLLAEVE